MSLLWKIYESINAVLSLKSQMASKQAQKIKEIEVFFKEVDQSDAEECRQMVNEAFRVDKGYKVNIDCERYVRFKDEEFESIRNIGKVIVAVLKSTNQMIGSFTISHYFQNIDDVMRKIILLEAVAVNIHFQKRGVSKLLLLEAERQSRKMEGYAIEGEVLDFADWEIARLVGEADAKVLSYHKVTKIVFKKIDVLKREMMITRLRKVIE